MEINIAFPTFLLEKKHPGNFHYISTYSIVESSLNLQFTVLYGPEMC